MVKIWLKPVVPDSFEGFSTIVEQNGLDGPALLELDDLSLQALTVCLRSALSVTFGNCGHRVFSIAPPISIRSWYLRTHARTHTHSLSLLPPWPFAYRHLHAAGGLLSCVRRRRDAQGTAANRMLLIITGPTPVAPGCLYFMVFFRTQFSLEVLRRYFVSHSDKSRSGPLHVSSRNYEDEEEADEEEPEPLGFAVFDAPSVRPKAPITPSKHVLRAQGVAPPETRDSTADGDNVYAVVKKDYSRVLTSPSESDPVDLAPPPTEALYVTVKREYGSSLKKTTHPQPSAAESHYAAVQRDYTKDLQTIQRPGTTRLQDTGEEGIYEYTSIVGDSKLSGQVRNRPAALFLV